jgi:hypothetical protein
MVGGLPSTTFLINKSDCTFESDKFSILAIGSDSADSIESYVASQLRIHLCVLVSALG